MVIIKITNQQLFDKLLWVAVRFARAYEIVRRYFCTKTLLHQSIKFNEIKLHEAIFARVSFFFVNFFLTTTVTPNFYPKSVRYFFFFFKFLKLFCLLFYSFIKLVTIFHSNLYQLFLLLLLPLTLDNYYYFFNYFFSFIFCFFFPVFLLLYVPALLQQMID